MSATPSHILVIDDEPDLRELYELTLLRAGYLVDTAASVTAAKEALSKKTFAAIITDMRLSDGLGLEVLQTLQALGRKERAIVITAYGSAENAVEALKAGAFDYLSKPVDLPQLRSVVAAAIAEMQQELAGLQANAAPSKSGTNANISSDNTPCGKHQAAIARIIGISPSISLLREQIVKAARGMAPVLIRGESGTGKELAAQAVHACSQRANGPFVAVNCGAIPENLLEAEFFGARKGSYTGATNDREGFFQAAHGGTLFLDELGDLPLAMQAKLLRVIQERRVRPLGATKEEAVDVRIVSATHHDLGLAVAQARFRQDLYYRLNVIELLMPALRERREDIPLIAAVLLKKIAADSGLPLRPLSAQAQALLLQQAYPGNVRELENILQRALAMSDGAELDMEDLSNLSSPLAAHSQPIAVPKQVEPASTLSPLTESDAAPDEAEKPQTVSTRPGSLPSDLTAYLDAIERDILIRALQENCNNRTAAAARLGITLRQIRYRMQQLHIDGGGND